MTAVPTVGEQVDTPKRGQRRASETGVRRLPPSPRAAVLIALGVRMFVLLAQHIHSHLVGQGGFNSVPYGGNDDGRYYYTTAQQLADGIEPPYILNFFPRVLSVFMDIGIRDLLALKLISFCVSSIAVVLTASMAWHMAGGMRLAVRRLAVIVASALASLFPSSVFWSTNSLMRDGWILSFVVISIWSLSDAGKGSLPRARWPLGLVALAAATAFRPYVLPVFLAALVSSQFDLLNPMRRLRPRLGPALIRLTLLALGFIGLCVLVAPVIAEITGFNILAWRTRPELLDWGSSLGLGFVGESPPTIIVFYLYSFVSNAIGPLPFQIESPIHMVAFIEVPFFIVVAAGLLRANYNNRLLRFCALFGLYWLLLLGLWNDVIGNSSRNRIIAWPILAIAAAPAIAQFISDKLEPGKVRSSGPGRRRSDRRSTQRRLDLIEAELSDLRGQSRKDPIATASAIDLATWIRIDQDDIRTEMREGDDERRSSQRRGTSRRFDAHTNGDSTRRLSISWFSVEPVGDVEPVDDVEPADHVEEDGRAAMPSDETRTQNRGRWAERVQRATSDRGNNEASESVGSNHAPAKTSETVAGIQALRAFSVMWVVIGHAAPDLLPGGFIGVDVFFVISGFLITSHLMNQLEGSRFSFGGFYLRRAQRLLPAALTVLAVTAVASMLLVPPAWEQSTLMGVAAAAAYVVNWWLADSAVNYFFEVGIASPVNHYWSLSVEEQFYFAWPVLLWIGWRVASVARRRNWRIGFSGIVGIQLLVVVVLSFGAALEVMSRDSSAGYFVTHGRAWEFAIGGLAHLGLRKGLFRVPGWTRPVLLIGGWAALASSGVLLGPTSGVPGFAAVIPVLAAAVLLLIGDDHRWRGAGRIIEWPSVQMLGDLAYSIYLWHWPFLVLAPFALKTEQLSAIQIVSVLLCTLLASIATQRWLENRFRRSAGDPRPLPKLAVYVALSLSVAGLAVGLASRQESRADDIAQELYELSTEQPPCFGARAVEPGATCPRSHELADQDYMLQNQSTQITPFPNESTCQNPPGEAALTPCSFGAPAESAKQRVALLGDSHARVWAPALDQFAERREIHVTSYFASSCVATDDVTSFATYLLPENRQACNDWRAAAIDEILGDPLIDTVVVSGHVTGQALLRDGGWVEDDGAGYASLWLRFVDAGKQVVVIEDAPTLPFFLPECLARTPSNEDPCTHPASAVPDSSAFTRALATLDSDSLDYVSTIDAFCGSETCHTVIGGIPVYLDSDHISAPFARSLAPRLEAVIAP